jgi:DNA-binding MarR family transcriptional regulator
VNEWEAQLKPAAKKTARSRELLAKTATKRGKDKLPGAKPVEQNWFRLGYLIHDVSRMRRTVFDERFKPEGITRSQWWVLSTIYRDGNQGILSTELANRLDVGKVTMSGLISRLEEAGYVYRRFDKSDRRTKYIFVTEAGNRLIDRMRTITEALNKTICDGMTPEDIAATEFNLIRIKDNLRHMLSNGVAKETS